MKIKVYRSKISKKLFSKPSFPRVDRKSAGAAPGDESSTPYQVYRLERSPEACFDNAAVGFYGIKNFSEIVYALESDRKKFGACLNRLIAVFSEIVESEGGFTDKFSENGALFAFKEGLSSRRTLEQTLIAALKMRYVISKLNRQWKFFRNPWKMGFGIDFGQVRFERRREKNRTYESLSGKPVDAAHGIGLSAAGSQILINETALARFPSLRTSFEIGSSFHVPVSGKDYLCRICEVVGMLGPQAKKIYEVYV